LALSYRDVEELLAERGVEELLAERGVQVDHVTIYRWVLRCTPLLAEAARPCRHRVGRRVGSSRRLSGRPGSLLMTS
jgi:transposase-like protein